MPSQPLIVAVDVVARRFNKEASALSELERELIEDYIVDGADAVEAEIGRSPFARSVTLARRHPVSLRYPLDDARAWDLYDVLGDTYRVVTATPDEQGSYTLDVLVGLDGPNERPIVRFVTAHAEASVRKNPSLKHLYTRKVTSVSAEGQSLSYGDDTPGKQEAGAGPDLSTLRRYKRVAVHKVAGRMDPPWPMSGTPVGYDPR